MYYEALKKNLFAEVEYPPELRALMSRTQAWRDFCALPADVKARFIFPDHQEVWDPGYKIRERAKGREDKEYFHLTSRNKEFLNYYDLNELVAETPVLQDFFHFAESAWRQASHLVLSIGRDLDRHIPGLSAELEKGISKQLLRLLHYTPTSTDEVSLADPHFDRSGFTLHLYESREGLQYLDFDLEWKDVPIKEGKTVVFGGYQLEEKTKKDIRKVWHRVVPVQNTQDKKTRISMVLFVPFVDTPTYPKEARSQDLSPGYTK